MRALEHGDPEITEMIENELQDKENQKPTYQKKYNIRSIRYQNIFHPFNSKLQIFFLGP